AAVELDENVVDVAGVDVNGVIADAAEDVNVAVVGDHGVGGVGHEQDDIITVAAVVANARRLAIDQHRAEHVQPIELTQRRVTRSVIVDDRELLPEIGPAAGAVAAAVDRQGGPIDVDLADDLELVEIARPQDVEREHVAAIDLHVAVDGHNAD